MIKEIKVSYLCNRVSGCSSCRHCYEGYICSHTFDINAAKHKDDLEGRLFRVVGYTGSDDGVLYLEEVEDERNII